MANYKKNQILIGDAGNIDNFLKQIGGTIEPNYHPSFINSRLINLPDTISVEDAIKKFNQSGLSGYAEPNFSISVPEPLFRSNSSGNFGPYAPPFNDILNQTNQPVDANIQHLLDSDPIYQYRDYLKGIQGSKNVIEVSPTIPPAKTPLTPTVSTQQNPNQTDIWQDTWQPTGQVNNGNPYSEAWKNISPNIGTKDSTPSNTTVNTTNPDSGQGNFPKLPNITQDVMQELDSLNGVNTWGNFKTKGLSNQANPNYAESKGYYINPYTGEYSF